jgi:hypothetical protein
MSQTIFTGGLGYEGKVTLTLKSNNRVLKSKTYKNKGTSRLFKFIGYCLIGAYEEAKNFLPTKVLLLYNGSNQDPQNASATLVEQRSAWQTYAQTPTIISEDSQVKVMYSFEVPRNTIYGPFNQVALYGAGVSSKDITDFSAYYFLVDGAGAWDEIDPEGQWSTTTVLLIEWELTISNKNVETNADRGE